MFTLNSLAWFSLTNSKSSMLQTFPLGFLEAGLTSKEWGEEGIEYHGLFTRSHAPFTSPTFSTDFLLLLIYLQKPWSPVCDPIFCPAPFSQDPVLHHLMVTAVKTAPGFPIPDQPFLVCKHEVCHYTKVCQCVGKGETAVWGSSGIKFVSWLWSEKIEN